MYRVRSRMALALALAVIGNCAHAERLQPGSPLSGYQCYHIDAEALKLTPEDAWDGKGFPPVFKGPSEESRKLGVASGVVYVAWPLPDGDELSRYSAADAWPCGARVRFWTVGGSLSSRCAFSSESMLSRSWSGSGSRELRARRWRRAAASAPYFSCRQASVATDGRCGQHEGVLL
jgi:hypothetical protein